MHRTRPFLYTIENVVYEHAQGGGIDSNNAKQLGILNTRLPRIESQQIEERPLGLFRRFA